MPNSWLPLLLLPLLPLLSSTVDDNFHELFTAVRIASPTADAWGLYTFYCCPNHPACFAALISKHIEDHRGSSFLSLDAHKSQPNEGSPTRPALKLCKCPFLFHCTWHFYLGLEPSSFPCPFPLRWVGNVRKDYR